MKIENNLLGLYSYIAVLTTALFIALAFPDIGQLFSPYTTLFLQIIFFLSALKFSAHNTIKDTKNIKPIVLVSAYILILTPIAAYGLAKVFAPAFALPLLILAAMPAGMTSILLTDLIGGSTVRALLLTIITSLLAPITIPLVIKALVGTTVDVPVLKMFFTLLEVIVIPFVLAQIVRYVVYERIQPLTFAIKPISMLFLGLLISGVVSNQTAQIIEHAGTFIPAFVVLFVFFFALHLVGYFGVLNINQEDRLASVVGIVYINFTLAIYLAERFFPEPEVLIPIILSVLPWSIVFIPFKAFVNYKQQNKRIG